MIEEFYYQLLIFRLSSINIFLEIFLCNSVGNDRELNMQMVQLP